MPIVSPSMAPLLTAAKRGHFNFAERGHYCFGLTLAEPAVDRLYLYGYTTLVYALQKTDAFAKWLKGLRDLKAKARILARLDSARLGNLGDCKPVGSGVLEMRIHAGPGYRLYFVRRKEQVVVLLCGGSKASQRSDILKAKRIASEIEDD